MPLPSVAFRKHPRRAGIRESELRRRVPPRPACCHATGRQEFRAYGRCGSSGRSKPIAVLPSARATPQTLAESHAAYLSTAGGGPVSADSAREQLEGHAGSELDPDLLRQPRIVLVAASFPPQVTASAVWLTEMGISVSPIEFNAYRTAHGIVLTVSQSWPIRDVEDFTVSPRQVEIRAAEQRDQARRQAPRGAPSAAPRSPRRGRIGA